MAPLFPVSLDVAGRKVLVVGGGDVAARKATSLVECGALLTVVAPSIADEIEALEAKGALATERRPYRDGEASGYRLVITATGRPEVDGQVAVDAEAAGVWVNAADDVPHCSFHLPAVHRDGPVMVTVSTRGVSPALARWLRDRISDGLGPNLGELAAMLGDSRARLHAEGRRIDPAGWAALLDGPVPGLVAAGDLHSARRLLAAALGLDDDDQSAGHGQREHREVPGPPGSPARQ